MSAQALDGLRRVRWAQLGTLERSRALQRPVRQVEGGLVAAVASILDDVRRNGDVAVREYGRRFDGVELASCIVGTDAMARAAGISPSLKDAIADAAARIELYHRAGVMQPYAVDTADGVRCERILRPIARVGLYVPAGSAPLPSTALMLGVPARIAGCADIVLCTPPRADGSADPTVLFAAQLCGITQVFTIGGAQAIAAMAHGTGTVPRCDKLFGPGNAFVTEAKRQVSMQQDGPAIDMPAGPSEVLVIADAGANPEFVAADLLSQAEHGTDSQVLLLSDDDALLDAIDAALAIQLATLPRRETALRAMVGSLAIRVDSIDEAIAISNAYAPEHLILALRRPRAVLDQVLAAGSVFLGDWAPEALGDYCSGTNHVLPTGGAARAVSGLSVASFQNAISVQAVERRGLECIGPTAVRIARSEGLEAHARAVTLRLAAA
jgi:histidinol dehydrogenase